MAIARVAVRSAVVVNAVRDPVLDAAHVSDGGTGRQHRNVVFGFIVIRRSVGARHCVATRRDNARRQGEDGSHEERHQGVFGYGFCHIMVGTE